MIDILVRFSTVRVPVRIASLSELCALCAWRQVLFCSSVSCPCLPAGCGDGEEPLVGGGCAADRVASRWLPEERRPGRGH